MISMTGYGHSIYRDSKYIMELEIKSYNNRFLDISHNINPLLSAYENILDEKIKKVVRRGHLDVSLRLKVLENEVKLNLDRALLKEYSVLFDEISKEAGTEHAKLSDYATLDGLITAEHITDESSYSEGFEHVTEEALSQLKESKARDGEGCLRDLERLGANFESAMLAVDEKHEELEGYLKGVLLDKYEALKLEPGKDDPRFLQEVAALLVKYSINEECSRLKVHMNEYKRLIHSADAVGKQLDFLCQEMNRECNTIASKSQLVEINLLVVKMKDNLENIREQIRNIE